MNIMFIFSCEVLWTSLESFCQYLVYTGQTFNKITCQQILYRQIKYIQQKSSFQNIM